MYISRNVRTLSQYDGREWVSFEDFLGCYPNASKAAKKEILLWLKTAREDSVEKRRDDSLFRELDKKCISNPQTTSLYAPTVTADGWVFWLDGFHEKILAALASLHSNEAGASDRDFFKRKLGWSISTMNCKTIMVPRGYRPNREDRRIFELFHIREMD